LLLRVVKKEDFEHYSAGFTLSDMEWLQRTEIIRELRKNSVKKTPLIATHGIDILRTLLDAYGSV